MILGQANRLLCILCLYHFSLVEKAALRSISPEPCVAEPRDGKGRVCSVGKTLEAGFRVKAHGKHLKSASGDPGWICGFRINATMGETEEAIT